MVVVALGYRYTLGEQDLVRMVAGVVYGAATGDQIFAGHHYGVKFSFGYYQLLYRLLPASALRDPGQIAMLVNYLGIGFAFLFALSLGLMLGKFVDRGVAAFSTISFLFCPVVLPFLASAHPMIGACAFLFLACWLLLLAGQAMQARAAAMFMLLAFAALVAGLCLRGEIAFAFPFVALAYWTSRARQKSLNLVRAISAGLVIGLAFGAFHYLQRPFVSAEGGAASALAAYFEFASSTRLARGLAVLTLSLGLATSVLLGLTIGLRAKQYRAHLPLVLACLTLIVPTLLFWLPNPQPARHFVISILGLYILLGQFWADKLVDVKSAIFAAFLLVLANQAGAELGRSIIEKSYQWSYDTGTLRRATQQVPLGFFPLDQRANIASQEILRAEALQLGASRPERLLILADMQHYLIAQLVANDPSLRIVPATVGPFDALLLTGATRKIYLIEKYIYWPKDVLSEILTLPAFASYPIYVQKASQSRYDKELLTKDRKYHLSETYFDNDEKTR